MANYLPGQMVLTTLDITAGCCDSSGQRWEYWRIKQGAAGRIVHRDEPKLPDYEWVLFDKPDITFAWFVPAGPVCLHREQLAPFDLFAREVAHV